MTGPVGRGQAPTLTGPALAAACGPALSASSSANSVRFRNRPNPLAPIRVCGRWIVVVDAGRPPSAFDPTGPTGALAQTRECSGAAPGSRVRAPLVLSPGRDAGAPLA